MPASSAPPDARDPDWVLPRLLEPSGTATTSDGVDVCFYDLGGHGPDLVLAHATGFCAAVLSPMAAALRDRFRCVALDLRAHGRSGRPADADFDWHHFATDVLAVVDCLDLDSPAGFGHSCGGATLLLAEQARPGTFSSLYCYEPVVRPTDAPLAPDLRSNSLARGALRRRSTFASREEALTNFNAKPPFDRFRPDVLTAYVDNGFAPGPEGCISLRCQREDEASMYAHGFSHDAFVRLATVGCPVTLACGAKTDSFGPDFLAILAGRLANPTTLALGGLGHFGPLEDPDAVACSVTASLADRENPDEARTLS